LSVTVRHIGLLSEQDRATATGNMYRQAISSCWDARPFGHNTHGSKSKGGCCAPFRGECCGL